MGKTYDDIATARQARAVPEAKVWGELLGEAYDIAMQLVALREARGLTQAQLAERCGIAQADISRIERGSTNPTVKTLQRIVEALDGRVALVPN
jgi:DNA-binding XRE family transcriptional regulator